MEEITREICKRNNIIPTRSKGQNFLISESVYDQIVEAAKIEKRESVIEVGPGLGFLTEKLAFQANQVTAIELDDKLAHLLEKRMKAHDIENVQIVNKDVLDVLSTNHHDSKFMIQNSPYKIVANLPYNITSVFLRKVYELENKPQTMVLMLQKEVAERIAARPGKMSKLSVMCQLYAEPEVIMTVPRDDFWPAPAVDSAVIRLQTYEQAFLEIDQDKKDFFRLLQIAFAQKRKMLKKNLANGYHVSQKESTIWLEELGFAANIRAQELAISGWLKLLEYIQKNL